MSDPISHEHCHEMLSNLSDYIDGDLRKEICIEIEKHIKTCDNCRVVVDTLKKTIELYEKNQASDHLPGGVKERLYAKLDLSDLIS